MAAVTDYIKGVLHRVNPKGNMAHLARIAKQRSGGIDNINHYCPVNIWYGPGNTFCTG